MKAMKNMKKNFLTYDLNLEPSAWNANAARYRRAAGFRASGCTRWFGKQLIVKPHSLMQLFSIELNLIAVNCG
jgi:hypothetical protein